MKLLTSKSLHSNGEDMMKYKNYFLFILFLFLILIFFFLPPVLLIFPFHDDFHPNLLIVLFLRVNLGLLLSYGFSNIFSSSSPSSSFSSEDFA